jgi:hypothetical protein
MLPLPVKPRDPVPSLRSHGQRLAHVKHRGPGLRVPINPAACIIKDGVIILRSMTFPCRFLLAAAATVSLSALSGHPQSTRTTEMDTGTTITSVTRLHSPRRPSPPFGAIDAAADNSVMLNVSVAPDLVGTEIGTQLPAGRSGSSRLSGLISSQVVPHGSLAGKNPQSVTGSSSIPRTFPVQKASSSMSLQDGSVHSSQGASLVSLQNPSSPSMHVPLAASVFRSGSIVNASSGSGASGFQPFGKVHSGRDISGFDRSGSDVSPEDADTPDVDASTSESSTAAADGQGAPGAFELIADPFGEGFQTGFADSIKGLEVTRTCGEACAFKGSLRQPEGFSGDLRSHGKEPNTPGSRSQTQRRLNSSSKVEPGSSDSFVLGKSSK